MTVTSPSPTAQANAKILILPPEVIEQILILAASHGFPSAIAHLSCTCRYFHQLVYRSMDNHLWREVFLTTFDDPRVVFGRIKSMTTFSPGNLQKGGTVQTGEAGFDWEHQFKRHMDAVRIMRTCTDIGENIEINSNQTEVQTIWQLCG
jgi:F-box-like